MIKNILLIVIMMTVHSAMLWTVLEDYTQDQLRQARKLLIGRELTIGILKNCLYQVGKNYAEIRFSNSILGIDISKRTITTYLDNDIEKCKAEKEFVELSYEEFKQFLQDPSFQLQSTPQTIQMPRSTELDLLQIT